MFPIFCTLCHLWCRMTMLNICKIMLQYFPKSLYSFNFTGGYECFYKRSLGEMMARDGCARSLFIAFPHSCVPGILHKNAGRRERKFI